jgi:hypothetical protein
MVITCDFKKYKDKLMDYMDDIIKPHKNTSVKLLNFYFIKKNLN